MTEGGPVQDCLLSGGHLSVVLVKWRMENATATWATENFPGCGERGWRGEVGSEEARHCFFNESQQKGSKLKFSYILG